MAAAVITAERVELSSLHGESQIPPTTYTPATSRPISADRSSEATRFSTTAIPDGGYGWIVVAAGFVTTFCQNGIINCWGVLQAALLDSTLKHEKASTLTFVGSLGLAGGPMYGLLVIRFMRWFGARITVVLGVFLMGMGMIASGFCTSNTAGLFGTFGLVTGVGMAMNYTVSNALPVQYFSSRLGLANGIIKLGGGVGGCVMAIALEAMYQRVGVAWTFRFQGFLTLAIGLPAAWMMKDRTPLKPTPFFDSSMFRSIPFVATFVASAIGVFALYIPPFYLPLFVQSIGLSSATSAGLVAAFNACNAIGRFVAGPLCDKIGSLNIFVIVMALNAVSMLAIWSVSNTLAPLVIFAIVNGVANGAYFTTQPTVAAGIFGPERAAVAMSMSITGWTPGYLLGAPIAGYLLQAVGGRKQNVGIDQSIGVYQPAIFYAGGMATLSAIVVILARLAVAKKVLKRV
ncbi:MFS general substrate transporter [Curvularia clavata]|uniref:MFS general substrate transporter n=1 Tax=Curvularia clavata TaxID=95742 RepID=A0A9Q9DY52_CURCL|nr:MFS general substrate transporter [Curvularia clavata]